jgi:hypothetical protein
MHFGTYDFRLGQTAAFKFFAAAAGTRIVASDFDTSDWLIYSHTPPSRYLHSRFLDCHPTYTDIHRTVNPQGFIPQGNRM